MTIEKKKLYSYPEVTTSGFADKIPTLQGGVYKVTTLQKIYNLFKNSFDSVYTTASAVSTQISNALSGYATKTYADNAANNAEGNASRYTDQQVELRLLKQNTELLVDVDASGLSELTSNNCILSISNFPGGTGNRLVSIRIGEDVLVLGDTINLSVNYAGFDVNLRSWALVDDLGVLKLNLYFNVHSNLVQPIFVTLIKTN